jgi:Methylase involved in ubiquinone/menaquinone biosynthesis
MTDDLPEHVLRNRRAWDGLAAEYAEAGRRGWREDHLTWGIWAIPEDELHLLPEVRGLDAIDLGCGTGYISAWLARRGARVVAIDNSERQLETARGLQREHGLAFPLIHGNAETVPQPDASFDLAISEYGASIWCDPYRWIPEAARLLRPGGLLVFLKCGLLRLLTTAEDADRAGDRLVRDYFGMHRIEWSDDGSVEFDLPYGEWIRLFRESGFSVERLVELRAPDGGSPGRFTFVTLEWARRWPSEEIWVVRREPRA